MKNTEDTTLLIEGLARIGKTIVDKAKKETRSIAKRKLIQTLNKKRDKQEPVQNSTTDDDLGD